MLFHTIEFLYFFIIILSVYYFLNDRLKVLLLLGASCFFYGYWNYKFLLLIAISTWVDFYCGKKIYKTNNNTLRKRYLLFSLMLNLGLLGFFKYYNFFIENMDNLLSCLNLNSSIPFLNIVLPIGISFYTFQSMSYTIDIYRKDIQPENSFVNFALYISFFPQLIAGPIERAGRLIPLIKKEKKFLFKNISAGFWLIFTGFFQKVVIADNMAIISDWVFEQNHLKHDGWLVLMAIYAFSFQILADFSGYTDMARGIAKCFGYNLCLNFKAPYFSTNPSEFWNRWHISLSSWLRDYLYIPLGGNKSGSRRLFVNLFITMFLGGLWHGASWNFALWGVFHGLLLIIYHVFKSKFHFIKNKFIKMIIFYHLICFGWIVFRSQSLTQVKSILSLLFFNFNIQNYSSLSIPFFTIMIVYGVWQYLQFKKEDFETPIFKNIYVRSLLYISLFYFLILFGVFNKQEFIYFQF